MLRDGKREFSIRIVGDAPDRTRIDIKEGDNSLFSGLVPVTTLTK